jgi:tRNA threonylcarbamoyladenosine biosynthesis protein TsaB
MKILYLDTSKEQAEIGLYDEDKVLTFISYQAHRELSSTILKKIEEILKNNQIRFQDLGGILCYLGPGSFTGLRIGVTLANSLSYGLNIPIEGIMEDEQIDEGIKKLIKRQNIKQLVPYYGSDPHVTIAKK